MRFTNQEIEELRQALEAKTGRLVIEDEACEEALHLMTLLLIISRAPPQREAPPAAEPPEAPRPA